MHEETLMQVLEDVREEVRKACKKHQSMTVTHEAYAVILEELDEFWDLVKANGPKELMRSELIQVAAMCVRTIIDLDLFAEATQRELFPATEVQGHD